MVICMDKMGDPFGLQGGNPSATSVSVSLLRETLDNPFGGPAGAATATMGEYGPHPPAFRARSATNCMVIPAGIVGRVYLDEVTDKVIF